MGFAGADFSSKVLLMNSVNRNPTTVVKEKEYKNVF